MGKFLLTSNRIISNVKWKNRRNPMYMLTWSLWAIFQIPTAVAQNITTVLVTRFISGAMGSTGSTMVGGTIADSKFILSPFRYSAPF